MPGADRPRSNAVLSAGKIGLAALLVAVVAYLILLSQLQNALEGRLSRLDAAGVPKTWADIIPPPVSDHENAAILYQQAVKHLQLTADDRDTLKNFLSGKITGTREHLQARIQPIVARNAAALDLAKQAAARPRCRWPVEWNEAPPLVLLPHLYYARICVRLLAAEAVVAARDADPGRAVDSFRAALILSARAAADPTLWPLLSGAMNEVTALSALQGVLERVNLDARTCHLLFQDLQGVDFRKRYPIAVAQEACVPLWCFDAVARDRATIKMILEYGVCADGPPPWLVSIYLSPVARLPRLREEIAYAQVAQESLQLAQRPYREAASRVRALDKKMEEAAPRYYLIIRHFAAMNRETRYTNEQAALRCERALAIRNAMQVALALKAYHAKHRAYPERLDALRHYPGWKLPEDPFSGNDFGYRRRRPGFVLYSWGDDLDDDNGRPSQTPGTASNIVPDGDIVWEFTR